MCEHMRDPYLSTVLPGIWKKNSGHMLKYYTMEEQYSTSLHTSRDFSRRVIQCTFCLTLFVFQSVSQSAAPYYMNMSSTIKKKVTLCETSIVDLNTERKDRQDARWRDPRVKINKEREVFATNSIKTRFDNFTLLENWVVCVCVNAILLWHKKMSWCFKRARLVSNTYK